MKGLRIRKVTYVGDRYYFQSPELKNGVVLIDGENEMGKSTFCDLIYFGLGGKVAEFDKTNTDLVEKHVIYDDSNNYVELHVEINGVNYSLHRPFSQNKIIILKPGDELQETKIYRNSSDNVEVFSDWILSKLNIESFELYQGTKKGFISVTDLLRLMYHDQKTMPDSIYKNPDNNNFMTDSTEIRKAIFEVIVGQSFVEYYNLLGEHKAKKKEVDEAVGSFKTFDSFLRQTYPNGVENVDTIKLSQDKLLQLKGKFEEERTGVKNKKTDTSEIYSSIKDCELKLKRLRVVLKNESQGLNTDQTSAEKVMYLIDSLEKEIAEIENIKFFDSKLKLFSQNSCPYCLSDVDRAEGKCICGADVEEEEYEKFFYTSDDYFEIVKSKKTNLNTLLYLLKNKKDLIYLRNENIENIYEKIHLIENDISNYVSNLSSSYNEVGIKQIDEEILKVEKEINNNQNVILMATKRRNLLLASERVKNEFQALTLRVQRAEIQAKEEMAKRVVSFNDQYLALMTKADTDCYGAALNEVYKPVINGGRHRARSALVAKRLMYHLTLLLMNKKQETNHFRFMLVDTPKKEGIDTNKILNVLSLLDVKEKDVFEDFQIILTTGVDAVPENLKKYSILHLGDSKLLKTKTIKGTN